MCAQPITHSNCFLTNKQQTTAGTSAQGDPGEGGSDAGDAEEESTSGIALKMLMKRGGRDDRTRELFVPSNTAMAAAVKARSDAEAAERKKVGEGSALKGKHVVLLGENKMSDGLRNLELD